jgi:hypothetical protein
MEVFIELLHKRGVWVIDQVISDQFNDIPIVLFQIIDMVKIQRGWGLVLFWFIFLAG